MSTIHHTSCPLDCPDSCSLDVTVDQGRVTRLEGSKVNPLTEGYICAKVRAMPRHVYGEDRLRQPLIRVRPGTDDAAFETATWDRALDVVAQRLRHVRDQYGGDAILPFSYGGSNGSASQDTLDARLWRRLGTARLARTVCAAATAAANKGLYSKMPGVSFTDYHKAQLIVIWGANPSASGIHLVPHILRAQKSGTKLVVIDPRRTQLAKKADLHLAPRPGTDLPLALAVIHWLFDNGHADRAFLDTHTTGSQQLEERAAHWSFERAAQACDMDAADIERFARLYAKSNPAVVRCGWGQERNRNGGSATAAILALPAVAGKFGVPGGGFTASNSGAWSLPEDRVINEPESETRIVNMNRLGQELVDGKTRLLFVYNCNPVATMPRQELVRRGLERDDLFTVVFEQVMTETARYADVVLPATTFLEHHDLRRAYGAYSLQTVTPVIPPVGEARPNVDVFEDLIHRLDLAKPDDIPSSRVVEALIEDASLHDQGRKELLQGGWTEPSFGQHPVQMQSVWPQNAERKIRLCPEHLDAECAGGLYHFQEEPAPGTLALISPATKKTISSTFGQLSERIVGVDIHPLDATKHSVETGDKVRLWNELGEVRTVARVTADVRHGVLSLPKGIWAHNTHNGNTSNALSPDTFTDLGEGACFNDARVQLEKVS